MQTEVKSNSGFETTSIEFALRQIRAHFWLIYFLIAILIIGLIFAYGLCAPLYVLGRFYQPATRLADKYLCRYIGLLMYLQPWLKGNTEIHLPPRKENRGVLIVSNHRSILESFILLSRISGIRMFTKTSLLKIPLLGMMMRLSHQIPAQKGHVDSFLKAMEIMRKRLRAGETVQVFPELTRCPKNFVGVQRFISFPFLLALQEKVDIVPVIFHNTDKVWPKGTFTIFSGHEVKVTTLAPIQSERFSSAEELRDEVRTLIEKELVKEAR
jgi:1-acyl-sn-glycerol-3-phosphate acyltransferase